MVNYNKIVPFLILCIFLISINGINANDINSDIISDSLDSNEFSVDNENISNYPIANSNENYNQLNNLNSSSNQDNSHENNDKLNLDSTNYNSDLDNISDSNIRELSINSDNVSSNNYGGSNIYVDANAVVDGDGSKNNPYNKISTAITNSENNDVINLISGNYDEYNMTINKSLSFIGSNSNNTILNANGLGQIFFINSNVNVSFTNLAFINGANAKYGGVIYNNGSAVISNCYLYNNSATTGGGAVYSGGSLNLSNSKFYNNSCVDGGGALTLSNSNLNMNNCDFYNNSALENMGGAIEIYSSFALLNNCNFYENLAYGGSGVYIEGSTVTISNSSFYKNKAIGDYVGGSAIYNFALNQTSSLTMNNCNILDNEVNASEAGGAIISTGNEAQATTTINHCNIYNNTASYNYGSAISNSLRATTTLNYCAVVNNFDSDNKSVGILASSGFSANYCWWGQNDNPSNLIYKVSGSYSLSNWAIMTFETVNGNNIRVGDNIDLVASIKKYMTSSGNTYDLSENIFNIFVSFSADSGSFSSSSGQLNSGSFTTNFSNSIKIGTVSAVIDNQKLNLSIVSVSTLLPTSISGLVNGDIVMEVNSGNGLIVNSGTVTIKRNGQTIGTATVVNGIAIVSISGLNEGTYSVDLSYVDNSGNFKSSSSTATLILSFKSTSLSFNNISGNVNSIVPIVVSVIASDGASITGGNVIISLGDKSFVGNVINGIAIVNVTLPSEGGSFNMTAVYSGYNEYPSSFSIQLANVKIGAVIIAPDMVTYKVSGENFTAKLTDTKGNVLVGCEVSLTLYNILGQSKTYWATTNTEGVAKLPIFLAYPSNYTIEVNFGGNEKYNAPNPVNSTLTITSTKVGNTILNAFNLITSSISGENFTAKLTDTKGNVLVGCEVSFTLINILGQSKTYWATTNTEGVAKLPIFLAYPSNYTMNLNFAGSGSYDPANTSAAITIISSNILSSILSLNSFDEDLTAKLVIQ